MKRLSAAIYAVTVRSSMLLKMYIYIMYINEPKYSAWQKLSVVSLHECTQNVGGCVIMFVVMLDIHKKYARFFWRAKKLYKIILNVYIIIIEYWYPTLFKIITYLIFKDKNVCQGYYFTMEYYERNYYISREVIRTHLSWYGNIESNYFTLNINKFNNLTRE